MSKIFLDKYQPLSGGASYYAEMRQMLNNVDQNKNTTKTSGNIQLKIISNSKGATEFRWTYTDEGIEIPVKCVAL
ncbi:MAG: hypothetical protein LBC12_04125 [Nitrososphaerota archaeon]|jgi:hypothetical protein|nr:hypothetical protein [Nitrososphaerota archaeon]